MSRHLPAKPLPAKPQLVRISNEARRPSASSAHETPDGPEDAESVAGNRPLSTPTVPRRRPIGPQELAEAADFDANGRVVPHRR